MPNPTVNVRNRTPLTSSGPLKLNVEDRLNEVDPQDTPVLALLGWSEDAPSNAVQMGANSLKFPCTEKTHTWNNDELTPNQSALASAYTSGALVLAVTTNHGVRFLEDDIVAVVHSASQVKHYRVSSVSSDTVTVVLLSASDANADSASDVFIIGNARIDGDVFDTLGRQTTISQTSNFTQIFQKTTGVTGTEQAIEQYGIPRGSSFDREMSKTIQELVLQMEQATMMGLRTGALSDAGPATNVQPATRMGGAWYYLRDSTGGSGAITNDAAGVAITEKIINDRSSSVWAVGGRPDVILTSYTQSRNMQLFIRPFLQSQFDQTRGGVVISEYLSTNGLMRIAIFPRITHDGDMLFLDFKQLGFGPMEGRELSVTDLPVDGDYHRASVLGEYTMEFMNNTTHHAWQYGLSTTGVV